MSATSVVLLIVFGGLATALAIAVLRFQLRRRRLIRAASAVPPEQLERLYSLLESAGGETPAGGVLVPVGKASSGADSVVSIPRDVVNFPWAGKAFLVRAQETVEIVPSLHPSATTQLAGRLFRYVGVPRERTESGKERNIFDPKRCLRASTELKSAVETIYPEKPAELLSYLISGGSIEFDPINHARVGTTPAWVQTPEFRSCPKCRKRLVLVLQLPGTLLGQDRFREGVFYLFGCRDHPDELVTLSQYS